MYYGDTTVLVTATASKTSGRIDFFPLTCDYEERLYAVGRIREDLSDVRAGQPKRLF